jgi:hypothetical protein
LARDVAARVGGEKEHDLRDLIGIADSVERNHGFHARADLRIFSFESWGSITPRVDGIDFYILRRARSYAAAFVMPRDAHFVAWYAKTPGKPVIPPREETLMIEPPLADIDAITAFIPRNTPS